MTKNTNIQLSHLRIGDALLYCGEDIASRVARFVDGSSYDHACLVVDFADDGVPVVIDIGFRGVARYRLDHYESKPSAVLVRRHRLPGGEQLFAERALEQHDELVEGYAFNRLLSIVLICLTRFAGNLSEMEPDMAKEFAYQTTGLLTKACKRRHLKNTGVCVDGIRRPMNVFASDAPDAFYYGLTHDEPTGGGLLGWVASALEFDEFLAKHAGSPTGEFANEDLSFSHIELRQEIDTLYRSLGFSTPSYQAPSNQELKDSVVEASLAVAEELAVAVRTNQTPFTGQNLVSALALWLLDNFLTEGRISTPADLQTTKSLYDVGLLDLNAVRWTKE